MSKKIGFVVGILVGWALFTGAGTAEARRERETGTAPAPCVRGKLATGEQHMCGSGCCSRGQRCGDGRCH